MLAGNQVQVQSKESGVNIKNFLKVNINGVSNWIPVLTKTPNVQFNSPEWDFYNIHREGPETIRVRWDPVENAVSYKLFVANGIYETYKPYMTNSTGVPLNRYGTNWYSNEYSTEATYYDITLDNYAKYNFLVYAYDIEGNRSSTPFTQLFAKRNDNEIVISLSPVYIYSYGNGASNYNEFKDEFNYKGTLTVYNTLSQKSTTVIAPSVMTYFTPGGVLYNFPQDVNLGADPVIPNRLLP